MNHLSIDEPNLSYCEAAYLYAEVAPVAALDLLDHPHHSGLLRVVAAS